MNYKLTKDMDLRLPEHREEVFFQMYEWNLRNKCMPGMVYAYLPALAKEYSWSKEDKLWFAFINGCTQNPTTSWVVFNKFPSIADLDIDEFDEWYFSELSNGKTVWQTLYFDADRRHQRNKMNKAIRVYKDNLNGMSQEEFFSQYLTSDDKYSNFDNLWKRVFKGSKSEPKFYGFGRLSAFSYIEYLWISGLNIDCSEFFMDEVKGSQSQRNGLCKVKGWDDLDDHKSNPLAHTHTKSEMLNIELEAERLLAKAQERFEGTDIEQYVSRFTMESQFCTYKSCFRPSRRYLGVYADMAYQRLLKAEAQTEFGETDFSIFRRVRKAVLPRELLYKDITSYKQNLYRNTGKVPLLTEGTWGKIHMGEYL